MSVRDRARPDLTELPGRGFAEASLVRLGVSDPTARLLAASPSLRLSWFGATGVALAFAVVAAYAGPGSVLLFLVLAPLLPLAGVAVAYGPGVDPAHEVSLATPMPASRLLFIRATAVLATTCVLGGLATLALPQVGWQAVSWLLPALALTVSSLALSTFIAPLRAAATTCVLWFGGLIAAAVWARSALVLFRGPAQIGFFALALGASLVLTWRRDRLEMERRTRHRGLIAAQDAERTRLERNLHDGAQQQLVAIAVKFRLARAAAGRDPVQLESLLQQLEEEIQEALDTLRDLARGTHPPVLIDRGLAAALEARARRSPVPVRVETAGIGRYPEDVEVAVYFCCLEALQNASKYAGAREIAVRLDDAAGVLRFAVIDDGVGFDTGRAERGSGLRNMEQRLLVLGGSLEVRSTPGAGAVITGTVPWRSLALDEREREPLGRPSPTTPVRKGATS
ncbi:MAG TPA: histidine kinase [Actinomycetota bacterium]